MANYFIDLDKVTMAVSGVLFIGMCQGKKEKDEKLTIALRFAICLYLLTCADIESNPGPKDQINVTVLMSTLSSLYEPGG